MVIRRNASINKTAIVHLYVFVFLPEALESFMDKFVQLFFEGQRSISHLCIELPVNSISSVEVAECQHKIDFIFPDVQIMMFKSLPIDYLHFGLPILNKFIC